MRVIASQKTGSQFLPRGIKMPRRAPWVGFEIQQRENAESRELIFSLVIVSGRMVFEIIETRFNTFML